MTVPVVGALLIFTLMIGPPAAARSFSDRALVALGLSVVMALVTIWAALACSFTTNWPVGFYVGSFSAAWFVIGRLYVALRKTRGARQFRRTKELSLAA
jgi:zinc/manganese transport system permease protein